MTNDTKQIRPYGTWTSPISAELVATSGVRLGQTLYDNDDLYWLEGRPSEGGRQVLVRRSVDKQIADVLPSNFNVRTLAHEYGGGPYTVKNGIIVFSNLSDQRIYKVENGGEPVVLTAEGPYRYADYVIDLQKRLVFCVQEDHSVPGEQAINSIVAVPLDPGTRLGYGEVTVCGCDFFSSPRVSPDGRLLTWLSWKHPNMPWDGCELWMGHVDKSGMVAEPRKIAGGSAESVFQPEWLPNGSMTFISDKTGWWNIYVRDLYSDDAVNMTPQSNDFGTPQWVFGMSTYAVVSDELLICSYSDKGLWKLAQLKIDAENSKFELSDIKADYTEFSYFTSNGKAVALDAAGPAHPAAIVELDLKSSQFSVVKSSSSASVDPRFISTPQPITFDTANGLQAYAFFYAPSSPGFIGSRDELPPLLVKSHGGPTGAASSAYNLGIQYWTSRGFAVVDVNYGGSSGFGREFRQRLNGQWGVVDVQDCENVAKYLVKTGKVDGNRLAITGGSAGGYTTLCALTFGDTFKAGASHFGVSDLKLLMDDTHKFESRYGDTLIGPYPEAMELYISRSPVHFTDKLSVPVIFFQGLEDKVVPPSQAEVMVNALRKKGLPVAYIAYEGEQHGFRKAENIKRTIEAEFYFYSAIFGFKPSDHIEPVKIENLAAAR
ncbi:MAG: S9 family peptidase [Candidatus Melainabacteria bacterium]|nr:MAG: S9 family peptidase [Candidatus Melainabacteria bacterium]